MSTPRPAGQAARASGSTTASASSGGSNTPGRAGSPPQLPEVSLLGTLPLCNLSALLSHISQTLTAEPPLPLCEKETVLSRHDDQASQAREKHDNAWAAVVRSRRAVRLRVREAVYDGQVACHLFLPLAPLPERQYPRVTGRPTVTVEVCSNARPAFQLDPNLEATYLPFKPDEALDTEPSCAWHNIVSAIGWRPDFAFLRYGLEYSLSDRRPPCIELNPSNPRTQTRFTLRVYRLFTPDPSGTESEWVPLDPDGATVVVQLIATVGGQVDPNHFTDPSILASNPPPPGAIPSIGGLDKESTIENAITHVEAVAKNLRGLVDLKRENVDF